MSYRTLIFPALFAVFSLCSSEPSEVMVGNRGFEEQVNGRPSGFESHGGRLESNTEKHSGMFCVKYTTEKGRPLNFFCTKWNVMTPVRYGDVYTFRFYAKGEGSIAYLIPQYSGEAFLKSLFGFSEPLTPEWKQYSYKFRIEEKRVNGILLGISVSNGGYAFIDDMSVTYDPADNQGRPLPIITHKKIILPVKIVFKDADGILKINGVATKEFKLSEGYNIVEIEMHATGKKPAFSVECPEEFAELRNAWREIPSDSDSLNTAALAFDDKSWPLVSSDTSMKQCLARNKNGKTKFRAIVLWNEEYYGKESPLRIRMKEWFLPNGSVQLLNMNLGPTGFPRGFRDDYKIILDLPPWITLMDMTQEKPRYVLNQPPVKVEKTGQIRKGNIVYDRYTLSYSPAQLLPYPQNNQQPYSSIPLMIRSDIAPGTGGNIFFGRVSDGNFTEIMKKIPVKIFPPINGRQPKTICIQTYAGIPYFGLSSVNADVLNCLVNQQRKIGVNLTLGAVYPSGWEQMTDLITDAYDKAGVRRYWWPPHNYPLHTFYMGKHLPENCGFTQVKNDPGKQAVYYGTSELWGEDPYNGAMYCPSYVTRTEEGRNFFKEMVRKGYSSGLRANKGITGIFLDWEQGIWLSKNNQPGKGSYCFCERCRKEFQKVLKLEQLPDEKKIKDQYYAAWESFRMNMDGKINEMIYSVCRELGMKLMYYTQTQMTSYYKHAGGTYDFLFLGYPSSQGANSVNQAKLDEFYRTSVQPHYRHMTAQVFPGPAENGSAQDASSDGFYVQSRWKTILLRLLVTFRGGVDICTMTAHVGGIGYYIGEATRFVAEYEEVFLSGKRVDSFPEAQGIAYPNLLGLEHQGVRLIFLFNEDTVAKNVSITLPAGSEGRAYYSGKILKGKAKETVQIPSEDAEILICQRKRLP